ncbi:hypothetical protein [Alistipes putredinis]|uniref:hypothetical protein n=1 Tax=Alistipes putredinis TaxID=28117 RepID=UPI003995728F
MTVSKISTEPHAQGQIEVFRLANAAGAYVDVCNIGAGITAVVVPDREGRMADVALGYRAYADYVGDGACFRQDARPFRQPDRRRALHARRQASTGCQPSTTAPTICTGGPDGIAQPPVAVVKHLATA